MNAEAIREGDIVEIDYIAEFTKEHINEGKALVIWKGNNNQPLVRKLSTKKTIWTCYEHIARVVGHIDIEDYMDRALSAEPCDDCISRQAVDELSKELVHTTRDKADFLCNFWEGLQKLPPVTPKEKTGRWIPLGNYDEWGNENSYKCSECGERNFYPDNYFHNCGAKMVEPQESKDEE